MIQKKRSRRKCLCVDDFVRQISNSYEGMFLIQRRIHPFFFDLGFGHKCARIASSKTVFKPFCVNAEHSRYLTAPISLRMDSP